jgi:hypothetical protein
LANHGRLDPAIKFRDRNEAIWQQVKLYSRAQFPRSVYTPADSKVFEYVQAEFIPGIIKTINGVDSLITKNNP